MEIIFGYAVAGIFGFVIGVVVFYFFSMGSGSAQDAKALKELEQEHTDYQQQVDKHFVETAELFKDLTDRYRAVYTHMAKSADGLCSEEVKQLQTDLGGTYLLADAAEDNEAVAQVDAQAHGVGESTSKSESKAPADDEQDADKQENDVPLASEVEVPPELRSAKS